MSEPSPRDGQVGTVMPWAIAAGAILAQQVASKAVRDGLFLSQVSASALPHAMLASAVLAVPSVLGASHAITRHGPGRVAALLLLASSALFGLEWALLPGSPVMAAWLLYLHIATLGGTTISAFYSCIAERFDPHSARRASGAIMSGAALGGLLGGLLVSVAARNLDDRALLLALAVTNLGCALGLARIGASRAVEAPSTPVSFVLVSLRKSGYLRSIAYLVLLTGFVSALLDYGFKAGASAALGTGPELLQLFAAFHTVTALLTALVQVGLAHHALERLGLAATLAVLPATVLLTGALSPWLPQLWSRALARGASSVFESSLFRSAYEPLYTPLSQRTRRSTKTLIDIAAGRLGEALGSGSLLALALLTRGPASTTVLLLAMSGAALSLLLSLRLHGGYVAALAASLRKGSIQLQAADIADSTTRLTMSQTHAELTRADLLAQLAVLRSSVPSSDQAALGPTRVPDPTPPRSASAGPLHSASPPGSAGSGEPASAAPESVGSQSGTRQLAAGNSAQSKSPGAGAIARVEADSDPPDSLTLVGVLETNPASSKRVSVVPPPTRAQREADTALLAAAADLLSAERPRVMRVLERGPLDLRLVSFAIPLLQYAALIEPITAALKTVVNESTGQLVDALHDPRHTLVVRRRIPRILKHATQPRAAQGLIEALHAPQRELRHRAATALAELTASRPELAPESRLVYELARDELRSHGDEPLHLHHLFAILSLALERDALRLARRALSYGDDRQKGTALEYLHNTLPEPLRSELIARLQAGNLRTAASMRSSRPPTA